MSFQQFKELALISQMYPQIIAEGEARAAALASLIPDAPVSTPVITGEDDEYSEEEAAPIGGQGTIRFVGALAPDQSTLRQPGAASSASKASAVNFI